MAKSLRSKVKRQHKAAKREKYAKKELARCKLLVEKSQEFKQNLKEMASLGKF